MKDLFMEFITNFSDLAIASLVIALTTILLVGCLKLIPGIKNMKNKNARNFLFHIFSLVISGSLSMLYYILIAKGNWDYDLLAFMGSVITEVRLIYPIYENYGIKAIIKKIGSLLVPSKSKQIDEVVDKAFENIPVTSSEETAKKQEESEKTGWLK